MQKGQIIIDYESDGHRVGVNVQNLPDNASTTINILSGVLGDVCRAFLKEHEKECDGCLTFKLASQLSVAVDTIRKNIEKEMFQKK
jgi:hypothetical protein